MGTLAPPLRKASAAREIGSKFEVRNVKFEIVFALYIFTRNTLSSKAKDVRQ